MRPQRADSVLLASVANCSICVARSKSFVTFIIKPKYGMDAAGVDDAGVVFERPTELWEAVARRTTSAPAAEGEEKNQNVKGPRWYSDAVAYWDAQEATDDGVLGGHGHLSGIDVRDSEAFLLKVMLAELEAAKHAQGRGLVAVDCGAGVGRVSACLLLRHFAQVDLVEPSGHLLEAARRRLQHKSGAPWPPAHKAVGFFRCGLETFEPEIGRYDVIWVQWALLYLTDDDAVAFFQRCAAALRPGGCIFVKENVCPKGFIVDSEDASVTRSHAYMLELMTKRAGLSLVSTARQRDFPKPLYVVRMYALKPKTVGDSGVN